MCEKPYIREKIARTRPSGFDPPRTVAERMLVSQPARLPGPGTCTWRYEVDSLYNNTSSAREWTTSSPPSEPTLLCSLRSRSPRGCRVASTSGGRHTPFRPLQPCNPGKKGIGICLSTLSAHARLRGCTRKRLHDALFCPYAASQLEREEGMQRGCSRPCNPER